MPAGTIQLQQSYACFRKFYRSAGQLFDGVLSEVQVAVHRLREHAKRGLSLPQCYIVEQHIGIANEDYGGLQGAFLEGIIRLFLRRFLLRLARGFFLVLVLTSLTPYWLRRPPRAESSP